MQLRTRIFIVASLGVLVILALSVALLIQARNKKIASTSPTTINSGATQNQNQVAVAPVGTEPTETAGIAVKPSTSVESEQNAVRKWARIFVEKYYTYSSDSDFGNIRDVKSMVTKSFWQKISAPLGARLPATTFTAATIENPGIIQSNFKDTTATVEIKASKISQEGGKTSTSNVDYVVSFIKIGSNWLINDSVSK